MIFEYAFMRKAFAVGILLAIIVPCIGIIVVLKRLSMIGDALSHSSLAGIAAGLVFNINPILGAIIASLASAFSIEFIRKKLPKYSEMSIAIIMSAGVGLAGVLSGFVKDSAAFNSFLFGSIVAITDFELYMVLQQKKQQELFHHEVYLIFLLYIHFHTLHQKLSKLLFH